MTQRVWITGASSGIGRSCAHEFAAQGCALILTGTNRSRLETVADECLRGGACDVAVLPYDLSDSDGIAGLSEQAWRQFGGIDILFCNAGISQRTTVEDTSMDMARQIMEVNFFAPVGIAKSVLPLMLEAGGGQIAVTTSICGRFGFPLRCAYSSSKHALYGFFETLQAEYHDRNISVTMVCPGRVSTDISVNALDKGGVKHGKNDPGQAGGLSAERAAKKIVRAIRKRRREVLVGRKELIMVYIKRLFPGLCARMATRIKPL